MGEEIIKIKQYFFVIRQVSFKEQKRNIDDTNLGFIWNVVNPFLYMLILSVYYQNVIIHKIDNFPIFVFTGITMIHFYTNATTGAMHSLVNNKGFITKTQLPIEIFIFQKVFEAFKEMCYSAIALIPIMMYFHIKITFRAVQLIPILLLTVIVVNGMGEILAIAYVYFADISYLYSVFMTMMFFVSGTFMPIDYMPAKLHTILTYNPIFLSIYLVRNSLIYNLPSHWSAWVKLTVWAVLLFGLGRFLMIKNKNGIVGKM
ncbi:MAG: ABC transporter permease [Pseudobutyrivibrio sp.]|uniref:ABC transporter permease n=1 Tax=Pseudobutyrivibrio sp. TaxID=2014367 RepID=UPI0025DA03CB|nr:ABC transporter permease [Pseudobutyrivibrio sp.]MBQ6463539.1 ABC transporter permease [Pseudobutyrivibrio sp.]